MSDTKPTVVHVEVRVGHRDQWGGSTDNVKFVFEETVPTGQPVMAYLRSRIREELKRQEPTFTALYPTPESEGDEL